MAIAAVGQLCSTASMAHNLAQCQLLVKKAVAAGAKALFLPEASDYIGSSPLETVSLARSVQESEFVLGLQREARAAKLPINVGIHEPAQGGEKVKNTLIWIDETGEITQRYQKIHLFDVEIKDGPVLKESRSVEKGMEILPPFNTPVGRVGLTICFDLRFPEISLSLKRQNAQIITYPSAFTVPTGQAHWEVLLRARAIETQSYIIAAAQSGRHNEKRVSYGHSMIVNPWGEVVAKLGGGDVPQEPQIAVADIDFELLEKVRREMPLLRRTDVYPEV
ncbi:Carbon-nitrogen hydrolase [Emmonsiellopsis sp. PD_33]|nr:Carbon-nitrogen hydrolase [Emmonsiellopsis sp. PD_33]